MGREFHDRERHGRPVRGLLAGLRGPPPADLSVTARQVRPGPAGARRAIRGAGSTGLRRKNAVFDADGVTLTYTATGRQRGESDPGCSRDRRIGPHWILAGDGSATQGSGPSEHRGSSPVPRVSLASRAAAAGDIRMVTRPDRGWFWFIPIRRHRHQRRRRRAEGGLQCNAGKANAEATLDHFPGGDARCRRSSSPRDAVSPARVRSRLLVSPHRHAGDRFVAGRGCWGVPRSDLLNRRAPGDAVGIEAAEVISNGLRDGRPQARRFAAYERRLVRRYRHFRRFAVGFYDPAFRDLFFNRSSRFGIYEAVLSVLGGNWRPSLEGSPPARGVLRHVALLRLKKRFTARVVVPDEGASEIVRTGAGS